MARVGLHVTDFARRFSAIDAPLAGAAAALGSTTIATQIILLREFLSAFYGNELVMGMLLASWMVITGIGSYLGKHAGKTGMSEARISTLLILLGLLPPLTLLAIRLLRNVVFLPGSAVGLNGVAASAFVTLLPYCLVSGFLFTLLVGAASKSMGDDAVRRIYILESAGSVAGGLLFNGILIFICSTFQSLFFLAAINAIAATLLIARTRSTRFFAAAGIVLISLLLSALDLDDFTRRIQFPGQVLLLQKDTPYGNLVVTRQGDQLNFFENNIHLYSTNEVIANEEAVHYAMLQHPHPRRVLLVSGGMSGMVAEILKYPVEQVDDAEINPWIVRAGERFGMLMNDPRVHVIPEDGRLYVKHARGKYDVVLIQEPDPTTAQLNRFYTLGFFRELRRAMNKGSVLSLSLVSSEDYLSPEARQIRSVLYTTLAAEFKNILIIPGSRDFFLASDDSLDYRITQLVRSRGVPTTYVNGDYLDDELQRQRSATILGAIDKHASMNEDFTPVAYYRELGYWVSQFRENFWWPMIASILIFGFFALRMNTVSFGIFSGGFAAASVEIVVLIAFQILYGYVYFLAGLIITLFLGGLALGALAAGKMGRGTDLRRFALLQVWIAALAISLPLILTALMDAADDPYAVHAVIGVFVLCFGFCVGAEFAVGSRLLKSSPAAIASHLYSIDLVGSALGALAVSSFLVPLVGVTRVCSVVAAVSLLSSLATILRKQKLGAGVVS